MQYNNYLEQILGNKTKIGVLRVLCQFPDKIWTEREIAKYIEVYNTTVLDNMQDLVNFGIVIIGMHGRAKTVRVNKKNFVFKYVLYPLFETEKRTIEALISSLKSLINKKETKLFLFYGSIVEHKEMPTSDIDLLIITYNKEKAEEQIIKRQSEIVEQFGNEFSITIWSVEEFKKKKNSPFLQTAKKNGIVLYGDWNENSERQ